MDEKDFTDGLTYFEKLMQDASKNSAPQSQAWSPNPNDMRRDGTRKGNGWLGVLPIIYPNGGTGVATEYTVGGELNGKPIDFPTLVPTLTPEEIAVMVKDIIPNKKKVPEDIFRKAAEHARERVMKGLSPFSD